MPSPLATIREVGKDLLPERASHRLSYAGLWAGASIAARHDVSLSGGEQQVVAGILALGAFITAGSVIRDAQQRRQTARDWDLNLRRYDQFKSFCPNQAKTKY